jgi:Na+/phosphate symporter
MLDENPRAAIGDNNPPTPIEAVSEEWSDVIQEAQNWTDGELVQDTGQMEAVDLIIRDFTKYLTALRAAGAEQTGPLHKAWKAEVAKVKVYIDDAEMIKASLVKTVGPYKKKLADEKAEAERLEWEKVNAARREAEIAASQLNEADIDAQRDLKAKRKAVIEAEKEAKTVAKDKVKRMRTVKTYKIFDHRAALNCIARSNPDAITAFIDDYVRQRFKSEAIDGVTVSESKEPY